MPFGGNFFYNDPTIQATAGNIATALYGDPQARARGELSAAQAQRELAAAGYDRSRTATEDANRRYLEDAPGAFRDSLIPGTPATPGAPYTQNDLIEMQMPSLDPALAPPPPSTGGTLRSFDPFNAARFARAGKTLNDGAAAFQNLFQTYQNTGTDDDALRGAVAGGHLPNENTPFSTGMGDRIAGRNQANALALQESKNASDLAVAKEREAGDLAKAKAGVGTGGNVQSVQRLGDGTLLTVFRDGHTEHTMLDGTVVRGASNDPSAIFNQSAARAGGRAAGIEAEAAPNLDSNYAIIQDTLSGFRDPKIKGESGWSLGLVGGLMPAIAGLNSGFNTHLKQLQGQAFLNAYKTLKGGGSITEIEGAKATDAMARLNRAQTKEEFYDSLDNAQMIFAELYKTAKLRASRGAVIPQMGGPGAAPAAPQSSGSPLVDKWLTP